jgi:UDP:flavonoid glycosyltransferase YjiC (YdhE family)
LVENFSRILVCPLDWGIGHATRCVPIIRQLIRDKHRVIIATDGRPFDFLKGYFPDLEFIRFPGFRVKYPEGKNMALKMICQSPSILFGIYREHKLLKKIIRDNRIDAVISDNRFGLWSKKAYSVYMTHQLMIKAPAGMKWAEPILQRAHKWIIRHYDECWVPDLPGEKNLSGDLGHKFPLPSNAHFIGILSRFNIEKNIIDKEASKKGPDLLFLLSGPEPQRSIFEEIVLKELSGYNHQNTVILRGLPGDPAMSFPLPGVISYNHLPDEEISRLIRSAGIIICRPGYSTIMDLATLGRSAVLVPTPGQTEQEYLAGYLSVNGLFIRMKQDGFNLNEALMAGKRLPEYIEFRNDPSLLENAVSGLCIKMNSGDQASFFIPLRH